MTQFSEDPALQLFQQEQQELMEQVGQALTALINTPSLIEFQRLRRSIRLIHQGAVQMELGAIARRTTQLLDILHPDITPPGKGLSSAQLETLTRLFRELQQVPWSTASSLPHPRAELSVAPSEPSAEFHEADEFSNAPGELSNTGSPSEVSSEIRQILLQNDIAEAIAQLEHSLSNLSGTVLIAEITTKVDALMGWAEVLNWSELGTLASTLLRGIKAHPAAAASIAAVGILGLKALHTTALNSLSFADETQPNTESVPIESPDDHVQTSYDFTTAKKFIWQSQRTIFVVDSTAIAETLVPQPSQILSRGNQRQLQWRNQSLSIVSVKHRLAQQNASGLEQLTVETDLSQNLTTNPVLVIATDAETVALEIEPDQFIRTPVLTVTPNSKLPDFCLGTTSLDQQIDLPIVDVLALLTTQSRLFRSPNKVPNKTADTSTPYAGPKLQVKQPLAPPHILVVDDSRTIRYLLQQVFERSGYRVTLAADGLEAIQQLQENPDIALMVSDVEMPNLTGFELLSRCRSDSQWQTLPIIILSQCPTDQDNQLSQQFGADAYLPKPFNHDVFLGTVKSLLNTKPQTS